ncbi:MAG: UDP-2,3-diacylglucosamine diphosphatase [Gammaproteobacteria bacterium]|nr:UDP-2,3-diacylglucosamine diphosphatase [Gammaproteobacteria bacterium]MCP5425686.1 UDP-2,3-diacylglucosamine diphosphatase [Gammaproteobacteria bacterium]MCP5459717.1 UDP-2,3-diacylglucosamine diphosphatase [Gammaproteobacteria bacterium]
MAIMFISDLHLDERRPAITRLFLDWLKTRSSETQALYILGDLFEVWIGDDDDGELGKTVAGALRAVAEQGIPVYFQHGNRDFLLGRDYAAASGIQLLPESQVIDLYGTPILIMHGDTLCTDDVKYQAFRAKVRSPEWQENMLDKPLTLRRLLARQLRDESQQAVADKPPEIMDVNQQAVLDALNQHGVRHLLHGHTHRPAIHDFMLDGEPAQRIVLGDWYEQGSVLICDSDGRRLERLPLT